LKWSPVKGTWPLHTRPSLLIQTLWPSDPVNATTDADWPLVVELIVPFHTPGVVAAVGVVGLDGAPVGVGDGVALEVPPPPPHAVMDRAAVVSARIVTHRFVLCVIGISRFGSECGSM
jgi:hypothetical protein